MLTNQLVVILNFNSRVLQKAAPSKSPTQKEINLLRRTTNLSCLYMTSLDERKWCKTKWKLMWSSYFHGSNPFPSCLKCTEIHFSGPSKLHFYPLRPPRCLQCRGGIPFHTYPYPHTWVTFDLIYCCLLKCFPHLLIIFSGDPCNSKLIYSSNSSL